MQVRFVSNKKDDLIKTIETIHELKEDLDLDKQDQFGSTALVVAAFQNNSDKIRYLVNAKADVNICNNNGNIPIMFAAAHNNLEMVRCLIDAKTELEITNKKGEAVFDCALKSENLDMLWSLLEAGAIIRNPQKLYDLLKTRADQDNPTVIGILWTLLQSAMREVTMLHESDYSDLMICQLALSEKINNWKKMDQLLDEVIKLPDVLRHMVLEYSFLPGKRGFFGNKTISKQIEAKAVFNCEAKPRL